MNEARWRKYLKDSERERIAAIDVEVERANLLKAERAQIANRAAQRARHAAKPKP